MWRMTDADWRRSRIWRGACRTCPLALRKRLAQAYPIYERGFHAHFARLAWLMPRAGESGRQGLFRTTTRTTLAITRGYRMRRRRWRI
jgi:hypothetical protein